MKNGSCPKCKSTDIFMNDMSGGKRGARNFIGFGHFSQVKVQSYVCGTCGFVEEYAVDSKELAKVKEKGIKL